MITTKTEERVAIRFLEYDYAQNLPSVATFSEISFQETKDNIFSMFDAIGGLANYAANRVQTNEMRKQAAIGKQAIDVYVQESEKQMRIEYEEYSRRVAYEISQIKEKIKNDFERSIIEIRKQTDEFTMTFEEAMLKNETFKLTLRNVEEKVKEYADYIEMSREEYSRRKEFITYCELQRIVLKNISNIMTKMTGE